MTGFPLPGTSSTDAARALALTALDRALMIVSRQERNYEPEEITVTLHTTDRPVTVAAHPHGDSVPAPSFPQLRLPTYTFSRPFAALPCAVRAVEDLQTFLTLFTEALDRETVRADGRLILAVHADVEGYDFDDAYAWSYTPQANDFTAVDPTELTALFHEDTTARAHPWHKVPWPSVSSLATAEPTA
ncbi:hypothetical protein ACFWGI_39785 [Streptomyces niveus]|uniref:hypothetical protein n=1 Tax=Streptomyces niveus TaxID=193462 RepID=UPI003664E987